MKYIDAEKLQAEINRRLDELNPKTGMLGDRPLRAVNPKTFPRESELEKVLYLIDTLQQEQPIKDESLGSPDYERGFKHGRDYQTEVTRKYTDKDKVVAYLVDKGYPISTAGEIPTYQETFDMISNAIKYTEQQVQPEVDLEKLGEIARHLIAVKDHEEYMRLSEEEWLLLNRIGYPERFNAKKEE